MEVRGWNKATTVGFQSVDDVDLTQVFEDPALVMKSIPKFMRGAFRGALKMSLQGRSDTKRQIARTSGTVCCIGGLFCCHLWKRRCTGSPPDAGNEGDKLMTWPVVNLVQQGWRTLGSCQRARQALEGGAVAPGDESTWKLLTDEVRRPQSPREPPRREHVDMTPLT